jgi:hypothetical protein
MEHLYLLIEIVYFFWLRILHNAASLSLVDVCLGGWGGRYVT